jgi:hypothetical protein
VDDVGLMLIIGLLLGLWIALKQLIARPTTRALSGRSAQCRRKCGSKISVTGWECGEKPPKDAQSCWCRKPETIDRFVMGDHRDELILTQTGTAHNVQAVR